MYALKALDLAPQLASEGLEDEALHLILLDYFGSVVVQMTYHTLEHL